MRRGRSLVFGAAIAIATMGGWMVWRTWPSRVVPPRIVPLPIAPPRVVEPPLVATSPPRTPPKAIPQPAPGPQTPAAPQGPVLRPGDRIGSIEIPRLKVRVPVFEGDNNKVLKEGAGHVPGTALPGMPGNICIAAHRDKFFRALRFIRPHDEIVLQTHQGVLRFSVDSTTIVKSSEVEVLMPAPHRDLTLVTCYPFFYVGHAPRRFIVHASREDQSASRGDVHPSFAGHLGTGSHG